MIKLPISTIQINPNAKNPICLWCHKPLDQTGIQITTIVAPIIKTRRYVCIYHPYDILYSFKITESDIKEGNENNEKDEWKLNQIYLNVSPTIRLFYANNFISLQKCLGETSTWGFVTLLPSQTNDWPNSLSYDDLISKVKGYLPFL